MTAPEIIKDLVRRFDEHRDAYRSGKYNETQLRRELCGDRPESCLLDGRADVTHIPPILREALAVGHGWREVGVAAREILRTSQRMKLYGITDRRIR